MGQDVCTDGVVDGVVERRLPTGDQQRGGNEPRETGKHLLRGDRVGEPVENSGRVVFEDRQRAR